MHDRGYYGSFGGAFIPEILVATFDELVTEFAAAKSDPAFWQEYAALMSSYSCRPTPITYAENLTKHFGGARISLSCNNNTACSGTSFAKSAFAMTVGGGFDMKLSKKFSLRPVQAEYLYTRFGNSCPFTICTNNNNQNSFRLKSGIVIKW